MADLATYQAQANSIYDPQLQADQAQAQQKLNATNASLDSQQATIEPAYQQAIQNLKDTTTQNTGKINQLYSQRLNGQISGLQGNDMGMMYAKAGQQQTSLETDRANKLATIASQRTLAQQGYQTDVGSLTSKYNGQKAEYTQSNYNSAVQADKQNAATAAAANAKAGAASQKQLPNDIIDYFITAPSQYGDYNSKSTNYHRWQAAEQELLSNGFDPYSGAIRQQLIQTFGSPDEKATLKK